jgi:hypothetical protein
MRASHLKFQFHQYPHPPCQYPPDQQSTHLNQRLYSLIILGPMSLKPLLLVILVFNFYRAYACLNVRSRLLQLLMAFHLS